VTFWDPANIRTVTGGTWIVRMRPPSSDMDQLISGISIDSRTLAPGQVFLALRGERFDGHDFLPQAVERGAPLLIVEDGRPTGGLHKLGSAAGGVGVLRVADTRKSLVRLATAYRRTLEHARVIAVTGSNGKTTTVRLIDAVLRQRLRGSASRKSFNNDVGVPLTILDAGPGDQYLVCEVGMNAPGEIAPLARMIEPDIAVITTIGRAHIESFGTVAAIAREKASLISFLSPNGLAVVPADTPHLAEYLRPAPNVITFGSGADADLRLSAVEHVAGDAATDAAPGVRFTVNDRQSYFIPLLGKHNAVNALAAIAVARRLGLTEEEIAAGLASVKPVEMRLNRRRIGGAGEAGRGIDLFNDAYNASPESMLAALDTFACLSEHAPRRVLILGDMLELGAEAERAHREIGDAIGSRLNADLLVTVGPMSVHIAERAQVLRPDLRVMILSHLDPSQAERVVDRLRPGDAVLLKGSRRMGLECIAQAIERRADGLASTSPAMGTPALR